VLPALRNRWLMVIIDSWTVLSVVVKIFLKLRLWHL